MGRFTVDSSHAFGLLYTSRAPMPTVARRAGCRLPRELIPLAETGVVLWSWEKTVYGIRAVAGPPPQGPRPTRPAPADLVIRWITRSAVHQITRSSSRTTPSPLTDNRVSITDHDLMVCPTVSPKYSLTSQNPASLTWEKNSEPAPTASTTSETWPVLMPSTRPIISDEAVMVATVAEPGARRVSTAGIQASTMPGKWAPSAHRASSVPIPLSTRTCLKPPPAATIRMMPATGGRPGTDALGHVLQVSA